MEFNMKDIIENMKLVESIQTDKREPLTFIQILNNPKYRKEVEVIEDLISSLDGKDDPRLKKILLSVIADLKEETGFEYTLEESVVDLSQYAKDLAQLTDENNHATARLLVAKIIGDEGMIAVANAILTIRNFERSNPISEYSYAFDKKLQAAGIKKFGEEQWMTHIYSNL